LCQCKKFGEALNANQFLVWSKKFGMVQNFLEPVEGQGICLLKNVAYLDTDRYLDNKLDPHFDQFQLQHTYVFFFPLQLESKSIFVPLVVLCVFVGLVSFFCTFSFFHFSNTLSTPMVLFRNSTTTIEKSKCGFWTN
jgi:hypothetical protein